MTSRRALLRTVAGTALLGAGGGAGATTAARSAASSTARGELRVSPTRADFDDPLTVRVTGVEPGADVTLTAATPDREGREWAAFARFEASRDGVVDPAVHAPEAGTYEGVRRMGLVTSMRPTAGTPSIYVPPDGATPLTVTARVDGRRVGRQAVPRQFGPEELAVAESPEGLVGAAFRPAGDGPHPGVLVLHGSGGEPDVGTAIALAAHGYAAFAPRYFGAPAPLPDRLAEVPLEYLDRCQRWLRGLSAVRDGPVGLVGSSKGAELALLAGATFEWVGAVAAYAPSSVVWAGLTYGGETTSSWTLDGEPVAYLPTAFPPSVVADYVTAWPLGGAVSLRPTYERPLERASDAEIEAATIPVEEIDGPVALVSGGDDALWPSAELGRRAARRLRDHPHPAEHRSFPDAGHLITFPYQPTTGLDAIAGAPPGTALALGGTPAGLARAARESWPLVRETLAEGLE